MKKIHIKKNKFLLVVICWGIICMARFNLHTGHIHVIAAEPVVAEYTTDIEELVMEDRNLDSLYIHDIRIMAFHNTQDWKMTCRVTNKGEKSFKERLRFSFYDSDLKLYFASDADIETAMIRAGETETVSLFVTHPWKTVSYIDISVTFNLYENTAIKENYIVDNALMVEDASIYMDNKYCKWVCSFFLRSMDSVSYKIPANFGLYIVMRDAEGNVIYSRTLDIKELGKGRQIWFNTGTDLSKVNSYEVSADILPDLQPGQTALSPTETPLLFPDIPEENILGINNRDTIIRGDRLGDLNIQLVRMYRGKDGITVVEFNVTNMGNKTFSGRIKLSFWDNKRERPLNFFLTIQENLMPGETTKACLGTNFDLLDVTEWSVSLYQERTDENHYILGEQIIENILEMKDICVFSDEYGTWAFEYTLNQVSAIDYKMPKEFELYLLFKNKNGQILQEKTITVDRGKLNTDIWNGIIMDADMSDIYNLEISTNLPTYIPPTLTPVVTLSPTLTPTDTPFPPQEGTETNKPPPVFTAFPTQIPQINSEVKKQKLIRPIIRVKIKKLYNNMWMAQIRIIKYQGTDIQIYYRRGKGKYKKIKLKRTNIKKNKKIFKVGYKKGKKNIYLRVRTYQKKGGKKWYSPYSKIRRLS